MVEVQRRRIFRATGRKDRHAKVFTSKGPRDRRVRLSADAAILLYEIQDQLGYDTLGKAVDWLIQKAETAIQEITKLPPENAHPPSATSAEFLTLEHPLSSSFVFSSDAILPLRSDAFPTKEDFGSSLLPGQPSQAYKAGSSNWAAPLRRLTNQGSNSSQKGSLQFSAAANAGSWA